jgi:hypothetical protein
MASKAQIKEIDDILQIMMPDDYYREMRRKLIPYLLDWKNQKKPTVAKPKVDRKSCNCVFKDDGTKIKCEKCGQTLGQWLWEEMKKDKK